MMDTSVYIFIILLDVFIVYTIFAIYFYVLFKYFLHTIEANSILNFLRIHLEFYKPIITLTKKYSKTNVNNNINEIKKRIDDTPNESEYTDFSIGTILILSSILGLLFIIIVYFVIFYKKILEQVKFSSILFTIIINIILLIGFELLFLYFVYCNIDVINIQKILKIE
jgi:hypothetical protein